MINRDMIDELCRICDCTHNELWSKVSMLVSMDKCFCDKPEDRLYHHSDNTWWKRAEDGRLVSAEPPAGYEYVGEAEMHCIYVDR